MPRNISLGGRRFGERRRHWRPLKAAFFPPPDSPEAARWRTTAARGPRRFGAGEPNTHGAAGGALSLSVRRNTRGPESGALCGGGSPEKNNSSSSSAGALIGPGKKAAELYERRKQHSSTPTTTPAADKGSGFKPNTFALGPFEMQLRLSTSWTVHLSPV